MFGEVGVSGSCVWDVFLSSRMRFTERQQEGEFVGESLNKMGPWGAGRLACLSVFSRRFPCKRLTNICSKFTIKFFLLLYKKATNENRRALWVISRCP